MSYNPIQHKVWNIDKKKYIVEEENRGHKKKRGSEYF